MLGKNYPALTPRDVTRGLTFRRSVKIFAPTKNGCRGQGRHELDNIGGGGGLSRVPDQLLSNYLKTSAFLRGGGGEEENQNIKTGKMWDVKACPKALLIWRRITW